MKLRSLLGRSSCLFVTTFSYRLDAERSASYPAVIATMARRETMRLRLPRMCHHGKTMQRFFVSQVKSICQEDCQWHFEKGYGASYVHTASL